MIPCKDCICKPICTNRNYQTLLRNCSLVVEYLELLGIKLYDDNFWIRMQTLIDELKNRKFKISKFKDSYHKYPGEYPPPKFKITRYIEDTRR